MTHLEKRGRRAARRAMLLHPCARDGVRGHLTVATPGPTRARGGQEVVREVLGAAFTCRPRNAYFRQGSSVARSNDSVAGAEWHHRRKRHVEAGWWWACLRKPRMLAVYGVGLGGPTLVALALSLTRSLAVREGSLMGL